jgi:hypothetical protein
MMRFPYHWLLASVALSLPAGVVAQEKETKAPASPKPSPYAVEVRFADDSVIKAALQDKNIVVVTRYGKLTVAVDEIRSIELGMRVPEESLKRVDAAIGMLGNSDFAKRETASAELLELREAAFPALQQAARSDDPEVSRRAKEVIKTLTDTLSADKLHPPRFDTIVTLDFTIVGQIETPTLKARTPYFGETSLKLAEIRGMKWLANERETKLAIDATRYGAPTEAWMNTGLKLRAGSGILLTATGSVDLRPAAGDAGTFVVGPDGRAGIRGGGGGFPGGGGGRAGGGAGPGGVAGGRGPGGARPFAGDGTQSPGTLIGRIGEYGKVFVVGSHYEGTAAEEGTLYLRIVPNGMGTESSGNYDIRVLTGR